MLRTFLDKLMKDRGISQNELSRRSGVPQPTIKRILDGESREPRRGNIEKIAKCFGLSVDDFYNQNNGDLESSEIGTGPLYSTSDKYNNASKEKKLLTDYFADQLLDMPQEEAEKLKQIMETLRGTKKN
jgi:transcriptional regulator with XRE-family HTH domain